MKAARRQIIAGLIEKKPFISLQELEDIFPDVTGMTLRRDIEYFEKQGDIIKVRGGARSMKFLNGGHTDSVSEKDTEKSELLTLMAKKAAGLVHSGITCFVDSGDEAIFLASNFPDEYVTVVTTSPQVALEIAKKRQPEIILVGGSLSKDNLSLSGSSALEIIDGLDISIAFMCTDGYSSLSGFSTRNAPDSEVKALVISKAKKTVMLMESARVDRSFPFPFCKLSQIDVLVTDKKIPTSFLHASVFPSLQVMVCSRPDGTRPHSTKCVSAEELQILEKSKEEK